MNNHYNHDFQFAGLRRKVILQGERGFTFVELLVLAALGGAFVSNVVPEVQNSVCETSLIQPCIKEFRIDPNFQVSEEKVSGKSTNERLAAETQRSPEWFTSLIYESLKEIYDDEKFLSDHISLARYDPPTFKSLTVGQEAPLGQSANAPHFAVRVPGFVEVKNVAKQLAQSYGGQIAGSTKDFLSELVTFPLDFDGYDLSGRAVAINTQHNKSYKITLQLKNPQLQLLKPIIQFGGGVTTVTGEYEESELSGKVQELSFQMAQKINAIRGVTLLDSISFEGLKLVKRGFLELVRQEAGITADSDETYQHLIEANNFFIRATEKSPKHPLPWIGRGITSYQLGDFGIAEKCFWTARILLATGKWDSTIRSYTASFGLGITYHRLKKYKLAAEYLREGEEQFEKANRNEALTQSAGMFIEQAFVHTDTGSIAEAQETFVKAADVSSPTDEVANVQLAEFYMARSYLEKGNQVELCKKALDQYEKAHAKASANLLYDSLVEGIPCESPAKKEFITQLDGARKEKSQISERALVPTSAFAPMFNVDMEKLRKGEDTLSGRLVAQIIKDITGADIVIINAGSIRRIGFADEKELKDLQGKGLIKEKFIKALLPFQDILVAMDMPWKDVDEGLKEVFNENEYIFERGRLPILAGVNSEISTCLADNKFRVSKSVFQLDPKIAGENKPVLRVVTLKYISSGQDGYTAFMPYKVSSNRVMLAEIKPFNVRNVSVTDAVKIWFQRNMEKIEEGKINPSNMDLNTHTFNKCP